MFSHLTQSHTRSRHRTKRAKANHFVHYISCFSGIGGLEGSTPPVMFCESDTEAATLLRMEHPSIEVWPDVRTFDPPKVDVIAGGWPCQDLSIAGHQAGIEGDKSRLLLDMLALAERAEAHTVVAENVVNLLKMNGGTEFGTSIEAFHASGYPFVSWRVVNARSFGLPQHRSRLLLIASNQLDIAMTIFREFPAIDKLASNPDLAAAAAGFYWTAGIHSLNYSKGYVPTIKIGSTLGIASLPAVHYGEVVRMLSVDESLSLQGFNFRESHFVSKASALRAAGNAVARPIGRWLLDGVLTESITTDPKLLPAQTTLFPPTRYMSSGISMNGMIHNTTDESGPQACNLIEFLDTESSERLSQRAASGLLRRLNRSSQPCPEHLLCALKTLANETASSHT